MNNDAALDKFPLPPSLQQKQLNRANGLFNSYSAAYLFFKQQRDKYLGIAKGYLRLISEHDAKANEAMLNAEACEKDMQAYEKLMTLSLGEMDRIEQQQGGNHAR
jgi:hypothetical protein